MFVFVETSFWLFPVLLVSNKESTKPKLSYEAVLDWSKDLKLGSADHKSTYQVIFMVDSKFGMPGAITVINRYEEEFYLDSVNIEGVVHIACNSWVQLADGSSKRIFFSTKVHTYIYIHRDTYYNTKIYIIFIYRSYTH